MISLRKYLAALALAVVSSTAMAAPTCTSTTNWVSLGPPGFQLLGNSFSSATTFHDCYTFSLSGSTNSFGGILEIDPWLNKLDIDLTGISLYLGNTMIGSDASPDDFAFAGLSAGGLYTLVVDGIVARDFGLFTTAVGYLGSVATFAAAGLIPEPATLALIGLALTSLAFVRRRRQ